MRRTQRRGGTLRIVHNHRTGPSQAASTTPDLDFVFAHQKGNALGKALRHLPTAGNHLAKVEAQVVTVETKVSAVLHEMVDFGVTQQRFRWDTSPVQTDPPQRITLHKRHLHAKLRGSNGRHIATWPSTDNDQITRVLRFRHVLPFARSVLASGSLPAGSL